MFEIQENRDLGKIDNLQDVNSKGLLFLFQKVYFPIKNH